MIWVDFLEEIQVIFVGFSLVLFGLFDLPDLSCSVSGFCVGAIRFTLVVTEGGMAADVPGQIVSFKNGN